jgi:next to BRCA1 gene 1 protein
VQAYKTLYRAARAKLRLNLRVTVHHSNLELLSELNQTMLNIAKLNLGSTPSLASTLVPQSAASSTTSIAAQPEAVPATGAAEARYPVVFPRKVSLEQIPEPEFKSGREEPKPVMETPPPFAIITETPPVPEKTTAVNLVKFVSPRRYQTFTHCANGMVRPGNVANPSSLLNATYSWSVYCNNCDKNMLNEHYHCNICDEGDYDLCVECKDQGVHCRGEGHWLIKRFLDTRGTVISSTTETVGPREKEETTPSMPGAFTEEKKVEDCEAPTRTCNNCIKSFTEDAFVTCFDCEDFDLCLTCLRSGKHGHHPGHTLKPVLEATTLTQWFSDTCAPGRNVYHHAICDMCDKVCFSLSGWNLINHFRTLLECVTNV